MLLQSKLIELGIQLPQANAPLASYVPARIDGDRILVSGQLPMKEGSLLMTGPLQSEEDVKKAQAAMEQCFLNGLAAATRLVEPDRIHGVIRLGAFVAGTPEFIWQHLVANGASHMAEKIFGESGKHVRAAVGVSSLPLNASVELEMTFSILPEAK